jgi:hypothetical protein
MVEDMREYEEQVEEEHLYKPKLFTYPDVQNPSAIFDYEDIENDDSFLVLCARAKPNDENRTEDIAFVWHGAEHGVDPDDQKEFMQQCLVRYFGAESAPKVKVLQEHSADESQEFMLFFE